MVREPIQLDIFQSKADPKPSTEQHARESTFTIAPTIRSPTREDDTKNGEFLASALHERSRALVKKFFDRQKNQNQPPQAENQNT